MVKYKKCPNKNKIKEAIDEWENSELSQKEIWEKYGITKSCFLYHLYNKKPKKYYLMKSESPIKIETPIISEYTNPKIVTIGNNNNNHDMYKSMLPAEEPKKKKVKKYVEEIDPITGLTKLLD